MIVYWSLNTKLFVVDLLTISHHWSQNKKQIKKKNIFWNTLLNMAQWVLITYDDGLWHVFWGWHHFSRIFRIFLTISNCIPVRWAQVTGLFSALCLLPLQAGMAPSQGFHPFDVPRCLKIDYVVVLHIYTMISLLHQGRGGSSPWGTCWGCCRWRTRRRWSWSLSTLSLSSSLSFWWRRTRRRWLALMSPASSWNLQGGFFNWPPPEFAKCWPVSNWFKKNVRVPDFPPPCDRKTTKCLA